MNKKNYKRVLKTAIVLTLVFFVMELIGGFISGSLSLLGDAAHMFRDVFALLISFGALSISRRIPTEKKTFGYHRLEIFAALINSIFLVGVSIWIIYEAYLRIRTPRIIDSRIMFAVAVIGFIINIYIAFKLHGSGDINIKSAFIHVLTDTFSSAAVIIASVLIYFTGFYMVDAILSIIIGIFILITTYSIIRESVRILLQYTPEGISVDEIVSSLEDFEGVNEVHNLHIWALCSSINILDAHVYTDIEEVCDVEDLKQKIKKFLAFEYNVKHATLEFEWTKCELKEEYKSLKH